MHSDIERAIDRIDHKIMELERAKRTLIEAFGEETGQRSSLSGTTKKQALIKLLQEEGPLSRSEILKKTGFARGTISSILNKKNTFKNKKGKWHLVERKEEGEQKEKVPVAN